MNKKNIFIECKCGCKEKFHKYDDYGRERKFKLGHYMRIKNKKHIHINNGIVLDRHIHDCFHNIYGKGNNTLEQFEEFKLCF